MQQSHGQEEAQCWYLRWLHTCAEHVDWTGSWLSDLHVSCSQPTSASNHAEGLADPSSSQLDTVGPPSHLCQV